MRMVTNIVSIVLACLCVATTSIQAAGLAMFWAGGTMTQDSSGPHAPAQFGH
jgi:hypothetical protein